MSVVRGDVVADVLRWWSSVATNSGLCVVKGGWGRGKSFIARSLLDADLRSEWWPGLVPGGGGGVGPLVVGWLRDRDAARSTEFRRLDPSAPSIPVTNSDQPDLYRYGACNLV